MNEKVTEGSKRCTEYSPLGTSRIGSQLLHEPNLGGDHMMRTPPTIRKILLIYQTVLLYALPGLRH